MEKRFRTAQSLMKYRTKFKKDYGYTPKVFYKRNNGKLEAIIVKPKGLKKLSFQDREDERIGRKIRRERQNSTPWFMRM